jgi:chemotaxis protein CheC
LKNYSELTAFQLDALKEISNIGAGNAATSLSQMVGRKIDMAVPQANIAPFNEITEIVGGAELEVAGGYLRVNGQMPMGILFLMPNCQVLSFLNLLFGGLVEECLAWNEMQQSAYKEIVNILAGSYLNALGAFTNIKYEPSVPALAVDMAAAILGEVLQQIGEVSDYALVIENVFIEKEKQLKGHFFLLPEPQSLELLLSSLGVL